MCIDYSTHCLVSHRGSYLCRIDGQQVCDDLLVARLPGNVATWLKHKGASGKRTPRRLRSILSREGVSGARGYCHVVLNPMDSRGEIRSVEGHRESWTVRLLSYSVVKTRMRSAGLVSFLCLSLTCSNKHTFMQKMQRTARDRAKSQNEKQKQREVNE